MQDDELWAVVDQRRRSVVDLLTDLSPAEWEQPSLCAEWSVPDVAAHLSLHPMRPTVHLLLDTLRARGDTNRLHPRHGPPAPAADRRPDRDDRGGVGERRPNPGLTVHEALIDLLVHEQDIAVPLVCMSSCRRSPRLPWPRGCGRTARPRAAAGRCACSGTSHAPDSDSLLPTSSGLSGPDRRSAVRWARCSCCSPAGPMRWSRSTARAPSSCEHRVREQQISASSRHLREAHGAAVGASVAPPARPGE